jgi:hydroxymethylglutaryl-CoA lyase
VNRIRITEVGPRDGLQNECAVVSVDDKVAFIDLLSVSGVVEVEVSSFVSPRWVPQLGDAEAVFARIKRVPGVVYSALVPNERGMARALEAKVDKVSHFTAASETFSRSNTNATIDETFERLRPVVAQAQAAGLPVHAYISCVVACPYEGPTDPRQVRDVAARLLDAGVHEIDLGETIGVAAPDDIERGVVRFDATCGGLGGCPYAPGAPGNVATEDLVYMCGRTGHETGVDLEALFVAARHIARALGRSLPGRVFTAEGR